MKKKKLLLKILYGIILFWSLLTLIVEQAGPEKQFYYEAKGSFKKALIVYSPDLFYDFDEQICRSFAEGLVEQGWSADVLSVKAVKDFEVDKYKLFVLCSNTYNWSPDWAITGFIDCHSQLEGKNIVAITLGSGSTARAQSILESKIQKRKGRLLKSVSYWLMRPNDETRIAESNVFLALEKAKNLGRTIGRTHENISQAPED